MAKTNKERVGSGLDLLKDGLAPFVEREFEAEKGKDWQEFAKQGVRNNRDWRVESGKVQWDSHLLLSVLRNNWNLVFSKVLGNSERNFVHELQLVRNEWAHQKAFSNRDAHRALDSIHRLLLAVSAANEARQVEKLLDETARERLSSQERNESRKIASAATEGEVLSGIPPWREIIMPHKDVAEGTYLKAEFAADLAQVHRGTGSKEYLDPEEFFRRTFLTDGLRHLIKGALKRLSGGAGEPVIELQTNFGGGKTHSMLALLHLSSGLPASKFSGVEELFKAEGIENLSGIRKCVLVGTDLNPAKISEKSDGVKIHTMWGELAYQLAGKSGYEFVEEADQKGTGPGADSLTKLFDSCGPCLILIDEWLAFVRQLYHVSNLPAGSFEANLTFAQSLTEAVKRTKNVLLVASVPASNMEAGGDAGVEAFERLQNVFARMQSPWKPASTEEGFEIVRRRLFEPIDDSKKVAQKDAVVREFAKWYRANSHEFPPEANEGEYERKMKASYPIHPEVFERLYEDWGSLERFQRTRGVLRLMASAIFDLWIRNDKNAMILPGMIPLDSESVRDQLLMFLGPAWEVVVETNVDGKNSLPVAVDRENPSLGRYSAARRVSRTIFLGSAPNVGTAKPGIDERNVKLGCVQPGESAAIFSDAIRKLTEKSTHLYADGRMYWYNTKPTVAREARDRAAHIENYQVAEEIQKRFQLQRGSGLFSGIHVFPEETAEVPDDLNTRLIILNPEFKHERKNVNSKAILQSREYLEKRGSSPRIFKNTLVFMACDMKGYDSLRTAVRDYLGWLAIENDQAYRQNLDGHGIKTIKANVSQLDDVISHRVKEAFHWGLVPTQPKAESKEIKWEEMRIQGDGTFAVNFSNKLRSDELLVDVYSGHRLRMLLDKYIWNKPDGKFIGVKKLWEMFGTYLYFDRLKDESVLKTAIENAVNSTTWSENFAYADGLDESGKKYKGLRAQEFPTVNVQDSNALLVKPEEAMPQIEEMRHAYTGSVPAPEVTSGSSGDKGKSIGPDVYTQYYGEIKISGTRIQKEVDAVLAEVVSHLAGELGSNVELTLAINANREDGFSEKIQRIVIENSNTLKIQGGFETD